MYKYIRLKISKMPYIRFSPMRSTFYHLETVVCKTEISAVFAAFYHHEVYLDINVLIFVLFTKLTS
ncbi:hypothetical protein T4D_10099, partial [Trichinella pseudospiralis]